MEKKTYEKPTVTAVAVQPMQIIAASSQKSYSIEDLDGEEL